MGFYTYCSAFFWRIVGSIKLTCFFHQMLLMFSQDETGTYRLLTIFCSHYGKKHAKLEIRLWKHVITSNTAYDRKTLTFGFPGVYIYIQTIHSCAFLFFLFFVFIVFIVSLWRLQFFSNPQKAEKLSKDMDQNSTASTKPSLVKPASKKLRPEPSLNHLSKKDPRSQICLKITIAEQVIKSYHFTSRIFSKISSSICSSCIIMSSCSSNLSIIPSSHPVGFRKSFIPVACGRDSADRAVLPAVASSVADTSRWFPTASRDMRSLRTRLRPSSRWPKWSPGATRWRRCRNILGWKMCGNCGENAGKCWKIQYIQWNPYGKSMHKAGTCSSMENHWKCWNLREVRERKIHLKPTFQGKKTSKDFPRIPLRSWIILISQPDFFRYCKGKSQNCHQHFCWGRKNTVTRCYIIYIIYI